MVTVKHHLHSSFW